RCGMLMRKFGIKYAASHPDYLAVRTAFTTVRNRADWEAVLDRWYGEDLPGVYPDAAVHRAQVNCEVAESAS
ncbi:MAG: tRNA-dihydrouridine synthase family protein, partial [Planctomycetota bacterium]